MNDSTDSTRIMPQMLCYVNRSELSIRAVARSLAPYGAGEKEIGGRPQAPAKGRQPLRTLLLADLPTALPVLVNMLAIIPGKTHNKRKNIYAEV